MPELESLVQRARLLARSGRLEEARELLQQVLNREQDCAAAWTLMAELADSRDEAIRCLGQVLRIEPHNRHAYRYLKRLKAVEAHQGILWYVRAALRGVAGLLALAVCTTMVFAFVMPLVHSRALLPTAQETSPPSCEALIRQAIQYADVCTQMGSNQVCYANDVIEAELDSESTTRFEFRGDIVPVDQLQAVFAHPLNLEAQEWGIAIFKLQATLPRTMPGQNVSLMVLGDTHLDNVSGDMQAFYFSNLFGRIDCELIPFGGILVRTPPGGGISFVANETEVTTIGVAFLRAIPNQDMTITILEGSGLVAAGRQERTVGPGQTVRVPLGGSNGLQPVGPPSATFPSPVEIPRMVCAVVGVDCTPLRIALIPPDDVQATLDAARGWMLTNTPTVTHVAPVSQIHTSTLAASISTPQPSLTATRTPAPTSSLVPTATLTLMPLPPPVDTMAPTTAPPIPPTSTSIPTPTRTPIPTATPTNTPTATPTNTPTATSISAWWDCDWNYSSVITVTASMSDIPVGYPVAVTFNHALLVASGKSLANGDDVRVVYDSGGTWVELDRVLDSASAWNTASTRLWFSVQTPLTALSSDNHYYLYYGNPVASSPPASAANVFVPKADSSTVALWHAEDGSGTILTDLSGAGYSGILTNMDNADWVSGRFSGALDLTTVDDEYVVVPFDLSPASITVEAWINAAASQPEGGEGDIFDKRDANGGYNLRISGTSPYMVIWVIKQGNTEYLLNAPGQIVAGAWYHVAGTWDGTTQHIFVNGIEVATSVPGVPGTPSAATTHLILGGVSWLPTSHNFNGLIDGLRVSNVARTSFPYATVLYDPTAAPGVEVSAPLTCP